MSDKIGLRGNSLLDPDMPTQELRLHMGELTGDEVLVARAAIRWANSAMGEVRLEQESSSAEVLKNSKDKP